MTKYKVGDVAALFSKPKSPTTSGGKKLQSLFEDYYSKKSKPAIHTQEENSERNGEIKEMNGLSVSKKSKKRKFSASNDSEFIDNVSSKKFKESYETEEGTKFNENKKQKKFKKQKDFQRKNSNDLEFKDDLFSKKLKGSYQHEGSNNNEGKKFKMQQDFPRKNKQSKVNSFNSSAVFPKFEAGNDSENDMESPSASKLNNTPKDTKQMKSFIKKSKKKSLDQNSSKLLNDMSCNDSDVSDDASLKKEIEEFMHSNSGKKKTGKSSDNKEKTFPWYAQDAVEKPKKKFLMNESSSPQKGEEASEQNVKSKKKNKNKNKNKNFDQQMGKSSDNEEKTFPWYAQDTIEKSKKKFLMNESSSPQKGEEASEQNVKSKKKNKNKNLDQQGFPRTNNKSKDNSFNSYNTESMVKDNTIKQNTLSTKLNLEHGDVKKPKKSKDGLNVVNAYDSLTSEKSSETTNSKGKGMTDFVRKPKNKNVDDTLGKDSFKQSNIKAFDDENIVLKDEEFNANSMQKRQGKGFESEAPDFIKLSTSDDDNKKSFEERLSRTLFVGNLPKNMNKQELRILFSTFGAVETVRLTGIETDKSKIFSNNPPKLLNKNYASDTVPGFVVFKEKQSAVEALKLSGSVFKGHHITVDFAVAAGTHKLYDNKRSIFIGNLPFNVQDESIWNAFSQCGRIEGVRVVRDRQTGLGKGFGYVLFSTVEAKQNALSLETLDIEGRKIRIKAVDSNKKPQKSDSSPSRRNTFKSRAIRMKKNKVTGGHKSIRKLTNKQRMFHTKKKTAAVLQKAMK